MKIYWAVLFLFLAGCFRESTHKKIQELVNNGNYEEATFLYEKNIKEKPTDKETLYYAREGAKLAQFQLRQYDKAIFFLKKILMLSPIAEERESIQKNIANIYFDNLNNYNEAIMEYSRLLQLTLKPSDKIQFKIKIAKSYFHLNDYAQTKSEVLELLKLELSPQSKFEVLQLQANTLFSTKNYKEAIEVYQSILSEFPELSVKENIALNLALSLEEEGLFKKALEVLLKSKDTMVSPEYVALRIRRLEDRIKNQPGARGLRK